MARTILGLATVLLLTAAVASAQGVDLSGEWTLEATAFFGQQPEGLPDCELSGSALITQDGSDLGGTASLTLDSGDPDCPAEMSAEVDGTVSGGTVEMGLLLGGQLGTAEWSGGVVVPAEGEPADGGILGFLGDYVVDSGPFTGTTGSILAEPVGEPPPSILEIPTLTTLGVIALVALLLAAAAWMLRRRPATESRSV